MVEMVRKTKDGNSSNTKIGNTVFRQISAPALIVFVAQIYP